MYNNVPAKIGIFVTALMVLLSLVAILAVDFVERALSSGINGTVGGDTGVFALRLLVPPVLAACVFIRILDKTNRRAEISLFERGAYVLAFVGYFAWELWAWEWQLTLFSAGTALLFLLLCLALMYHSSSLKDLRSR